MNDERRRQRGWPLARGHDHGHVALEADLLHLARGSTQHEDRLRRLLLALPVGATCGVGRGRGDRCDQQPDEHDRPQRERAPCREGVPHAVAGDDHADALPELRVTREVHPRELEQEPAWLDRARRRRGTPPLFWSRSRLQGEGPLFLPEAGAFLQQAPHSLLTGVWGFPKERLYATVYQPGPGDLISTSEGVPGVGARQWDLQPIVRFWVDGTQPNHGVVLSTDADIHEIRVRVENASIRADAFYPEMINRCITQYFKTRSVSDTLSVLNSVAGKLADAGEPVRFIFVTVDPERDTPEVLARYVTYFNGEFVGVTGERAVIDEFTRQLGIMHMRVAGEGDSASYLVDHTASVLLFNPDGHFQGLFSPPLEAGTIASEFLTIAGALG